MEKAVSIALPSGVGCSVSCLGLQSRRAKDVSFLNMVPEGSQHLSWTVLNVAGSRNLVWLLMAGLAFHVKVKRWQGKEVSVWSLGCSSMAPAVHIPPLESRQAASTPPQPLRKTR